MITISIKYLLSSVRLIRYDFTRDISSIKFHFQARYQNPGLSSSYKSSEAKTLEGHWMNKKPTSNYHNNINLPNNLKFGNNSKTSNLISPTEVVGLLPSSFGGDVNTIPSLVSPAHQLLKNKLSQKPKPRHDRKKRRSSKYRGIS